MSKSNVVDQINQINALIDSGKDDEVEALLIKNAMAQAVVNQQSKEREMMKEKTAADLTVDIAAGMLPQTFTQGLITGSAIGTGVAVAGATATVSPALLGVAVAATVNAYNNTPEEWAEVQDRAAENGAACRAACDEALSSAWSWTKGLFSSKDNK